MSLPVPSTNNPAAMDPRELEAIDAPLVALASRSGGDLRKLLYYFFSFLQRRTDFYLVPHDDDLIEGKAKMGFREGDAEKVLLAAFRQFPLRKMPRQADLDAAKSARKQPETKKEQSKAGKTPSKEVPNDPQTKKDEKQTSQAKPPGDTTTTMDEETVRLTEEGLQVPVGNGGTTKRYRWTQTVDECSVLIGIPEGLRGKDLDVSIKPSSISVKSKKQLEGEEGVHVFLEGELTEKIVPSESTWSLEGGVMVLVLYKPTKKFWETVVQGDDKIDTSLVDSRRHIGEYDESTQAQIRKIIFDQNQARKGLPTSDEITGKKLEIPSLPRGVEYIDKEKLDEIDAKKPTK